MFDADYLIKREQQELAAALRAADRRVRQVHLEMADAYTFRISEMKRQERLTTAPVVADRSAHPVSPKRDQRSEPLLLATAYQSTPIVYDADVGSELEASS